MKLREFSEINLNNLYENFSNYSVTPEEPEAEIPKVGDSIRTNDKKMDGKVVRVGKHDSGYIQVFFKIHDGRMMKTPLDNVTIVQKLADEDMEEGMMGGINRSAPATDVSYEDVLDETGLSKESRELLRYQVGEINKKVKMLNDMFIKAKNSKDFSKMDTIKAALSKLARQKLNLTKGYDLE